MRRRRFAGILTALTVASAGWLAAQTVNLPNTAGDVKFAVIGDTGSGDKAQFEVAAQMVKSRQNFKFDRVIMLGDDIYGGQSAQDLDKKFAQPYKDLLAAGVDFYAALGNHDSQNNRNYPPFHMNGERFYTHTMKNVRFFVLDTDELDPKQQAWLDGALKAATEPWKIVYFHHPLYSDGATHGSDVNLRVVLEPMFVKYGVSVVFTGHDHIYERIIPQKGITHFVEGSSGQLREGDYRKSAMSAAGYDADYTFMLVEINGNDMTFQAITRTGQVADSGVVHVVAPKAGL
jgi:3',5'-cyclic AMP phosphodiesterase CpdA